MRTRGRIAVALFVGSAVVVCAACEFGGTDEVTRLGGTEVGEGGAQVGVDSGLQGLCGRAGGAGAVKAITADAMGRLAADCRIGSYFTLDATQKVHHEECMSIYLQEVFTCPGVTYAGSKDSSGAACRDMQKAHENRGITTDDKRAFLDAFVGALRDTGKLIPTDVGNVVTKMTAENGVSSQKTGNPKCGCANPATDCVPVPPPPDAGPKEGGAADTGPIDAGTADAGPG
jgi:hypothetical protein